MAIKKITWVDKIGKGNELKEAINTNASTMQSINSTGSAKFANVGVSWGNSPTTPLETDIIDLSVTDALNAGKACIYYSGNVLDKTKFTGGTISFLRGSNTIDTLCTVWIEYDKNNEAFHVDIIDGFTGNLPNTSFEASSTLTKETIPVE